MKPMTKPSLLTFDSPYPLQECPSEGLSSFPFQGNNRVEVGEGGFFLNGAVSIQGENNLIVLESGVKLEGGFICVNGSHNRIRLSQGCKAIGLEIYVEDDDNELFIGENFFATGKASLHVEEGTRLIIGKDVLVSGGLVARTSDGHSLLDAWGRRTNKAKDIVIGTHVWIGHNVTLLKGTSIADHCVVGACSLVNKAFPQERFLIAGNPAKAIKKVPGWDHRKLKGGISPLDMR